MQKARERSRAFLHVPGYYRRNDIGPAGGFMSIFGGGPFAHYRRAVIISALSGAAALGLLVLYL